MPSAADAAGPVLAGELLAGWARRAPHKPAVREDGRTLTWAELDAQVTALASGMAASGVGPGDAVGMLALDRLEVFVHYLACLRLGAVRVGINARFAAREVLHVVRDCEARMVVVEAGLAHLLGGEERALRAEGRLLVSLTPGDPAAPCLAGYDSSFGELCAGPAVDLPAPRPGDVALISYTSGTTGLPKGVLVSQAAVGTVLVHTVLMIGLGPDDVWFQATSLAWIASLLALLGLVNGMTVVLPGGPGGFDAGHFLRAVGRHRVTGTVLAPVMIRRVLDELDAGAGAGDGDGDGHDLSSFRTLVYGSSPAPPALLHRVHAALPATALVQLYGITECSGGWVSVLTHADHLRGLAGEPELLASCGRPGPWVDVAVTDDDGREVARGERGEVRLRSPMNCLGYHRLPELTAGLLDGAWIRTHDIGRMDDEGYLYLTDRKDFMIITGGMNVYPSVVENVLAQHPDVADVAVVGAAHEEWGEAVVAMVEPRRGATPDPAGLVSFCRERLGAYQVPKHVAVVDALPRGVTGKVLKPTIIAELAEHPERLPWHRTASGAVGTR
ncbi:AMP-binding protein [Pseudonocardia sp. KRD-184]|uniref:AMP-binding protein n=1 Tax=Pseudonocardia oceani TaxID=2792013 RepID=A0ABS6U2J5_9PSEU|nr:AMP-binding protein [Pseudonocardia oceani]MBW0091155.1 AMP-binding protein [Pseudonocardia oceani]MBW0095072.1 AMP-binding protein [Pseudonocardia oceani]MBW0107191.1 AMP-binding protein [Pseudonocardia oceani]MBW0119713.1 AMP-binding protein [Pseudonocardia oceani]MBW0126376.1 AMP-binding protein [Pseudonocardia oceani]